MFTKSLYLDGAYSAVGLNFKEHLQDPYHVFRHRRYKSEQIYPQASQLGPPSAYQKAVLEQEESKRARRVETIVFTDFVTTLNSEK